MTSYRTKSSFDININFKEIDSALQTQRGLKAHSHNQCGTNSSNTNHQSRSKTRSKIKRGHKRWTAKNKILELELKIKELTKGTAAGSPVLRESPLIPGPSGPSVHDSEHSDSTPEPEPFQPTASFNRQLAVVRKNKEKN